MALFISANAASFPFQSFILHPFARFELFVVLEEMFDFILDGLWDITDILPGAIVRIDFEGRDG